MRHWKGLSVVSRTLFALIALGANAACNKRNGEAVVLSKEHIAAALPAANSPTPEQTPASGESVSPEGNEVSLRPMRPDEIAVDQYVMKKEDRGTARDPRAMHEELWLVKVRMLDDGRIFNVPAKQAQFARIKEGDRVPVTYHIGKYTGTVWASEIVD